MSQSQPETALHTPPPPGLLWQIFSEPLNWLLVFIPLAAGLHYAHAPAMWVFGASCVAIIPLAGLMGRATENLSETMGAGIGGLMNATFGNAAELIIALAALRQGPEMYPLVQASLTGSIIGNILLVLGLSLVVGGARYPILRFNATAAGMGSTLLTLAAIGMLVPTLYYNGALFEQHVKNPDNELTTIVLSEEISVVLFVTYILSLVFSLRTHRHLFAGPEEGLMTTGENHQPEWDRKTSIIVLVLATIGVAWMSEMLVASIEPACEALGLGRIFVGVIVVAIIGNAAEHSTAIMMALKNKMDLSVNIAIGSSLQIAMFVTPVLVFASMLMNPGRPLDLHFRTMELVAVVLSIFVLALVSHDGESHWLEGVMLLALYVILGVAFFHLPNQGAMTGAVHH